MSSLCVILKSYPIFTARHLAQVVGRVISMTPVIGNVARIMSKYCYMAIENRSAWDKTIVSFNQDKVLTELRFWENNISKLNSRQLGVYSKSSVVIYSDASNVAAGAYTVEVESKLFHKMWSVNERAESSTWRELKAIELALSCFKDSFQGKTIKWFTDSQNCVKIVNAGSMKEKLHSLALSIFSTCVEKGISIDIQWIPRTENEKADYISKMFDFEDWGVTLHFFAFMDQMWGSYTVDRFASSANAKLHRFNSLFWNPGSEAIDAFSQNWFSENNWLVPPINLVIRAIRHLVACKAKGTLIVPKWKSAAFWPLIFSKNLEYKSYVKDVIEFSNTYGIFEQGSNKNTIFGVEPFATPILAVLLDANS